MFVQKLLITSSVFIKCSSFKYTYINKVLEGEHENSSFEFKKVTKNGAIFILTTRCE